MLPALLAGPLLSLATTVIDRAFPDPEARAKAQGELLRLQQEGALAELAATADVPRTATNTAEATAGGVAALWRPAIGFVCAAVLAYTYVLAPLLAWACAVWAPQVTPPALPLDEHLWEIVVGILGLGGFRTAEKMKGRA